jgi:putative ABC transport system permease protein
MGTALRDLRYGLRMLLRSPGFTALAVIALALGIGANSAIFSFVDAILLRPLPVAHPEQLVKVNAGHKDRYNEYSSYPDYLDFQSRTKTLAGLAAYGNRGAAVSVDGPPILVSVCVVSPNYFPVLGVKAGLGRTFAEESADPNNPLTAVASYRFWQRRLGGDPGVAGKVVRLNKRPCTILGVMPHGFQGATPGESPDFWIPVRVWTQITGEEQADHGSRWLELIGRLHAGTSLAQVRAEIETIGQQLRMAYPETNRDTRISVLPESETRSPWARVMGDILLAVALLVLVVACINISNLLLSRAEGRQREIAVRLALGAGPFRIVRQLLAEGLLLAMLGAGVALVLAGWTIRLLPGLLSSSLFVPDLDLRLDGRVIGFTLLVSLLSVFGFGMVPALRAARLDLNATFKQHSAATTRGFRGWTLGNTLVVVQLALSLMLLVGAGLLARTAWNVRYVDPGFQGENRLLVWMVPAALGYNESQTLAFYRSLLASVQGMPGVKEVTLVQRPPLYPTEGGQRYSVKIPGYEMPADAEPLKIRYTIVWPNYFETMGMPILRGRTFSGLETRAGQGSILINEAMARHYWADQDPLGKHVQVLNKDCEIIGVVQDGKYVTLREEAAPYMFLAVPQFPSADMTLLLHSTVDPHNLVSAVERELQNLAKDLPAPEISTLDEVWRQAFQDERLAAILVCCLSGLAAFLATVGLYGLMSFSLGRRIHEIGIRMALGAQARTLLRMVIKQSVGLVLCGAGLGLIAAFLLTRFLASQLFGVTATDPLTYAGVTFLLVFVALLACYLPARRAARVDPIVALRYE